MQLGNKLFQIFDYSFFKQASSNIYGMTIPGVLLGPSEECFNGLNFFISQRVEWGDFINHRD